VQNWRLSIDVSPEDIFVAKSLREFAV